MDPDTAVALVDPDELPEDVPAEQSYSLLADGDRRRLLVTLAELDTAERLSALTRSVAMRREDPDAVDTDWIRVRLHHVHLPKLEAAAVVSYDREELTVELTSRGDQFAAALLQ